MAAITAKDLTDAMAEFLEAFVHQVLWMRGLYPEDLFERRRLHSTIVKKSRHPALNEHIKTAIDTMQDAVQQQVLKRVAVVIVDSSGRAVERHVVDTQISINPEQCNWQEFESAIRGCLIKHQYVPSTLKPLPPGCTFEVVAYTSNNPTAQPPVNLQLWVAEGPSGGATGAPGAPQLDIELPKPYNLQPVKSAAVQGVAGMQLYLETL